jgi:asparagine synthase (glutamine-hydrolysing)
MCGISAIYADNDSYAGWRMLNRLGHRGPDDSGAVAVEGSWIGQTRLSIVDLTGGHQPLRNNSGTLYLVGNGEVYNHEQVRAELEPDSFRTKSDNEVALHLLEQRGPDALGELHGMYAFLAAGVDGSFIAVRDPVGIKPLYWARRDGGVRFASEMRAFDADWQPFVEAFPPGHYWTPEDGLVRFAAAVPEAGHDQLPGPSEPGAPVPDHILRITRDKLVDSVERQMMGDVPVGVFLSGGLDSSLVAAIAARWMERRGERLKTFAVGTEGSADLIAAREVAEFLDTEHHERVYTAQDALEALPEVVRTIESYDPSLVRSAVPNFMLAELAARHVKVVLTGEGADEIFAGYEYLREISDDRQLHDEIVRMIEGLHNLNLQRCDRVTMAFGLEARVPFLERDVIELGLKLPAGWKLSGEDQPEKRLLRLSFEGWLPHKFLWREKSQFGDGSGAADVLQEVVAESVPHHEFEREREEVEPELRTREEAGYYRIFREHLRAVRPELTLGRFATA